LILLFVTAAGLWAIPELVKTATYSRDRYPFVYFSSTVKKFMIKELYDREDSRHDDEGRIYTDREYDAAIPLFNYRQLTVNGEMPDSIDGIAIDPREVRVRQMFFRYSPKDRNRPEPGLYIMYESMPKKAKLESPGDLFRLKSDIEFITAESNRVNAEKSKLFRDALLKEGYAFPAQWTYGDLSIRKPYDEGYFSLDADGRLYHIKMVNGRPFVKNTQIDPQIEPAFFAMEGPADKRFYGVLFDKKGYSYILEEDGGKYRPLRLDIDPINLDTDELLIMGNLLYWTVSVQTPTGKQCYALHTKNLERVRNITIAASPNQWDVIAGKIFPFYLTFRSPYSEYIAPQIHFATSGWAWILSIPLAGIFWFCIRHRSTNKKIFDSIYILIFGIVGVVALLVMRIKN
jgi:hypothetical protein